MPFKSEAQRRKCYALRARGRAKGWNCDEWARKTTSNGVNSGAMATRKKRVRANRVPRAPETPAHVRAAARGGRRDKSEEDNMDILRRMVRDQEHKEFDPSKRGDWRGSSRDLVVNKKSVEGLQGARFDTHRDEPDGYAHHSKSGRWFIPEYLSYSEYHGGALGRSNVKKWEEEFKDGEGDWWHIRKEHHGSRSVMLDLNADGIPDEALEVLSALADYPALDEEGMSNIEHQDEEDAWENWVCKDFKKAIEKELSIDIEECDDEQLYELFCEICDDENISWSHSAEGPYIDVKKVAKHVEEEDLEDFCDFEDA